jgi:hypothetical protein
MQFGKGKNMLIKDDVPGNIHPSRTNIQALVSLVKIAITKKGTLL